MHSKSIHSQNVVVSTVKRRQDGNQSVADPSSKSQSAATLKKGSYNDNWEKEFKWLYLNQLMKSTKCQCCETKTMSNSTSRESNAFADGPRNFKKSGLV